MLVDLMNVTTKDGIRLDGAFYALSNRRQEYVSAVLNWLASLAPQRVRV